MYELSSKERNLLFELNSKLDEKLKPQYRPIPRVSDCFNLYGILEMIIRRVNAVTSMDELHREIRSLRNENGHLKLINKELERELCDLKNKNSTLRRKNEDLEEIIEADLIKRRGNYRDDITHRSNKGFEKERVFNTKNSGQLSYKQADDL